jgi:serine/threonine protein kinase
MEVDRRRMQYGGKILGKGSYGCVFDPPLKCISGVEKRLKGYQIGKMTTHSEAEKEIYISSVLKTIPYIENYVALVLSDCLLKPRVQQDDPDLRKCDILAKRQYGEFVQLILPYSGQAIHFFNKQIRSGAIDFYKFGCHLLEGASLLLLRGIVHFDLHKGNILVDDPNKPIIIDFGLSWRTAFLPKIATDLADNKFEPDYAQYSPELSIPEAVNGSLQLNTSLFHEILEKKNVSRKLERVLGVPYEQTLKEFKDFIYNSQSLQTKNWLKFYQTYWPKFDAWAVGRILLDIYHVITSTRGYKPTEKDVVYAEVLRGLCTPSPKKRLTAAKALQLWNPHSPILPELKQWI